MHYPDTIDIEVFLSATIDPRWRSIRRLSDAATWA